MCGIAGILTFDGSGGHAECGDAIRRMTTLMQRRGPDDEGHWNDEDCALGFRRLSILDISPAGHQPMRTADGRHVLVFNGEVYNFRELRRELEQSGATFRSTGDAEVVLQALAAWGKSALSRFNGMFALAWYDTRAHRLLLARDPVGIKPLYYMNTAASLVFGSQFNQLLAHPASRECDLSRDGLALYLRLGYIPAPYGALEKTHMLAPGSWLEADNTGALTQGQYYSFPRLSQPDLRGQEGFDAVNAAVAAAVKRQMVSDVPIGCFLSGGIDSPLVAAKMAEATEGPVQAFTMGLSGNPDDESADAALYADELGLRHTVRHFAPEDALNMLDDVVAACSEPFADNSIFPTMMVSRLARDHVKVMLSGDGGDELFWGYAGRFASVLAQASQFRKSFSVRQGQRVLRRLSGKRNPGQHLVQPTIGHWYRHKHSHRSFEWHLEAVFDDLPQLPSDLTMFDYDHHDQDETAQWLRWNEFVGHLTMVLLKVDRASMHHSLEVRVPLLDMEVVELATRFDWKSCLDLETGIGKRPLRESLARHVRHQTMTKRGFSVPMAEWLRGPLRKRMEDLLLGRRALAGLPLKPGGIEGLARDHMSGRSDRSGILWLLFSLALWDERHLRTSTRFQ